MNQISSLYTLIKEISLKKGRPLKIICDWDECLSPYRPYAIYKFGRSRGLWLDISFSDFFETFWEKTGIESSDSSNKEVKYFGDDEKEKLLIEDFMKLKKKRREERTKGTDKNLEVDSLSGSPSLSFVEDLIHSLKEDSINKLIIISTTRARIGKISANEKFKRERFSKSFSVFTQCMFKAIRVQKVNGQNKPHRWEWIKDNHPDFDIFIDDDAGWIRSVERHFGSEKIYALPDYKYNRHVKGENIHRYKNVVSELRDSDFALAALEKEIKEELAKKNNFAPYIIIPLLGIIFLIFVIVIISKKPVNSKEDKLV